LEKLREVILLNKTIPLILAEKLTLKTEREKVVDLPVLLIRQLPREWQRENAYLVRF
jgi:hypothetical protein